MNQAVQNPVLLVKAIQKDLDQTRIPAFVKQKCSMRHKVCNLEQSCFCHAGEVRDISKVIKYSPSGSKVPEPTNPDFGAFVEAAFRENQKPPLRVVTLAISSHQK